jgi:flagellar assembly protein FliH
LAKAVLKEPNEVRPWHDVLPPAPTVWVPSSTGPASPGAGRDSGSPGHVVEGPEALLEAARHEAEQILEQAREESEQIRADAARDGHAAGHSEAMAEDAARRQQLSDLLAALAQAYHSFCADQVPALASLVTEAAGRLMQEQLSLEPQRVLNVVREALQQVIASTDLRLHLNPDDLEIVRVYLDSAEAPSTTDLQIIADPSVERGGCWLETGHGEVDATITGRLSRLSHALDEVG